MFWFSRGITSFLVLALTAFCLVSTAQAAVDYSGTWQLNAITQLANADGDCEFSGQAMVMQTNGDLAGRVELTLTSGPGDCPSEMGADMTGIVDDGEVQLGMMLGGNLGEAIFGGAPGDRRNSLMGGFEVTTGPFAGETGEWGGILGPPPLMRTSPVPGLAYFGALILLLGLFGIGVFNLRRQHQD